MSRGKWKALEMNRRGRHPEEGQLVALRMLPINVSANFYKDARYDIGVFRSPDEESKKLWWHGTCGVADPVKLKKRYAIFWCPVEPFDEMG